MQHECGACEGSGICQNDHHNWVATAIEGAFAGMISDPCPACGEDHSSPGNCSVCGGTGVQDD